MSVDLTFQLNTQQAISAHLLNPETTCLAFRDRQWTVIPKDQALTADQNFFARWISPAPALSVETYGNVQLCFEALSLNNINETFEETALNISRLFTGSVNPEGSFDEGYKSFSSENLLNSLNFLKSLILENEREDYQPYVQEYEKQLQKLKRDDVNYATCDFMLRRIKEILAQRDAAAPSAAAAAPLDPATELRQSEIARQEQMIAEASRSLSVIFEGTQHHLTFAQERIERICAAENDTNAAISIYDETQNVARYQMAEANLRQKHVDLDRLLQQLEGNMTEAQEAVSTILERHQLERENPNIQHLIRNINFLCEAMNRLRLSQADISQRITEAAEYTSIKNHFQQRQQILQRASEALRSYAGKTPVLISMPNGALVVEEKPFTAFLRRDIETLRLPNGLQIACKKESIENLKALFALAMPASPSPVSDKYLLGVREEFFAALEKKSK